VPKERRLMSGGVSFSSERNPKTPPLFRQRLAKALRKALIRKKIVSFARRNKWQIRGRRNNNIDVEIYRGPDYTSLATWRPACGTLLVPATGPPTVVSCRRTLNSF
jgi:hypothetical protein